MVLRSSITDFISFTPVLPCQVSLVVGVVEEGTSKNDRKVSKVEVGSPWRGLCSGQLLGLEVLDFYLCNNDKSNIQLLSDRSKASSVLPFLLFQAARGPN